MTLKGEIKILLIKSKMSMTDLVNALNKKHNRSDSVQNLNNKLTRETIKYKEVLEIADVLGYELEWSPKVQYIPAQPQEEEKEERTHEQ